MFFSTFIMPSKPLCRATALPLAKIMKNVECGKSKFFFIFDCPLIFKHTSTPPPHTAHAHTHRIFKSIFVPVFAFCWRYINAFCGVSLSLCDFMKNSSQLTLYSLSSSNITRRAAKIYTISEFSDTDKYRICNKYSESKAPSKKFKFCCFLTLGFAPFDLV